MFYPEVRLSSLLDGDYPAPVEIRDGFFGRSIDCMIDIGIADGRDYLKVEICTSSLSIQQLGRRVASAITSMPGIP